MGGVVKLAAAESDDMRVNKCYNASNAFIAGGCFRMDTAELVASRGGLSVL